MSRPSLPPIFFFLLFLLLLLAPSFSKPCPPCGSTTVPFPLSTSPSCGDPTYSIRCASNSSSLFLDALSSSYPISSISPSLQSLTISLLPIPISTNSPSSCSASDTSSGGLLLNSSAPFNISSANSILFLNCTKSILESPLNCSSSSPCHAYLNSSTDSAAAACRRSPICCEFRAGGSSTAYALRTNPTGCSAYRSFVDLDTGSTPVAEWSTKEGVALAWVDPREPVCRNQADCEDGANATCTVDPQSSGGSTVRRCFCNEGFRWDSIAGLCAYNITECTDCSSSKNHAPLIAGLVSGLSAAALVFAAGFLFYRRQRRIRRARERLAREREEILNAHNPGGRTAKIFSGRELRRATSNFSRENHLGSGGYGDVYRGSLPDGTPIAVKCAKLGSTKSTDQVLNEVRILSQVNHRYLVRLLGCCVDLAQPLMVYEFIPNGTLFHHLAKGGLSWRLRLSIAHQTAEGLAYLHSSAVPPIYHRDVKSSNILLDEKLNAKVADFGLSRLAEADLSHVTTCAQGTLGYLDPEYYRNYQLTDKSDVYSFGVVLLELLTSKKAIDFGRGPEDANLAVYVQQRVDEERLMDVVDEKLKAAASQVELDSMKALGFLAMGCLEEKRQNRPSMKEVYEEIEYIISIVDGSVAGNNQDTTVRDLYQ
ncbi:wall-associated receptor kinase-like 20 [Dendrobium catenatum]|uniref:Wall-associated receptor kinase-like 20 n=1 Tax=Dendrobium catenatum TaxID=906689 RepID=A0A2I0VX96_9ASPA|nr:wall-associated receptor kinase-like 20 [Dendrobium catenatum]PKU68027.1 Wall-associated receptor kinase-like 20 [Dendrobium catenatum]